jgi:hypothetical protein
MADEAFKRLGRTVTLPAGTPELKFWISFYLGFGFEAIDTLENRTEVMDRVMQYLLPSP